MSMQEDGLLIVKWKIGIDIRKQYFKDYKVFDYSSSSRKKMNDVDFSYVPRFLLVSAISDKDYKYVKEENKLYVRSYVDKMIPIDRIHEIICTIPTKIVLKTPIGNGLEIDNCYDGRTKKICYDKDNAYETIEVGQSAAHIYNQLYRNCSNLPYTPYGVLVDSKEEKTDKNENDYDLL